MSESENGRVIEALATGVVFGLSAGLAPGPLLALVMSQTIRYGLGHGLRVAVAPILTDLPIIVVATLFVGALADARTPLGAISIVGAGFVAYLAVETWRTRALGSGEATAPRSWTRGITVNVLSPHPYLFWFTVGAPALLVALGRSPLVAAAFLVAFYGCLVGAKAGVALATSRAGDLVVGRGYRWTMHILGGLLGFFAVALFVDGITLIRLPG